MEEVRCNQCGTPVNEPRDLPSETRKPCPECGSLTRRFGVTLEAIQLQVPGFAVEPRFGTPTVVAHAGVAEGTGAAHDATVRIEEGPITRPTIATYKVELRWDAPTKSGESTMLSAWVNDEMVQAGMQRGDCFGLLMDLADEAGILPPWSDDEDEQGD
jgi:hypothetical protein